MKLKITACLLNLHIRRVNWWAYVWMKRIYMVGGGGVVVEETDRMTQTGDGDGDVLLLVREHVFFLSPQVYLIRIMKKTEPEELKHWKQTLSRLLFICCFFRIEGGGLLSIKLGWSTRSGKEVPKIWNYCSIAVNLSPAAAARSGGHAGVLHHASLFHLCMKAWDNLDINWHQRTIKACLKLINSWKNPSFFHWCSSSFQMMGNHLICI